MLWLFGADLMCLLTVSMRRKVKVTLKLLKKTEK